MSLSLVLLFSTFLCLHTACGQNHILCPADEWRCNSTSRCIKIGSRCNGMDDCGDNSDEENCEQWQCPPSKLKCSNGRCIYLDWRCNGRDDCGDTSDENNCDQWECPSERLWTCGSSNQCVWLDFRCDGRRHCDDNSDERNCSQWQCPPSTWRCADNASCIWIDRRCNGQQDCNDGSDESGCGNWTCPVDTWRCSNNRCISTTMRCDGQNQCGDGSDEQGCDMWTCPTGYWQCRSRQCTPVEGRCDGHRFGHNDCRDGSDEDNCGITDMTSSPEINNADLTTILPSSPKGTTDMTSSPEINNNGIPEEAPVSDDTLPAGAIAGIVVGGVALTILLVLLGVLAFKKRKQLGKGTSGQNIAGNPNPTLAVDFRIPDQQQQQQSPQQRPQGLQTQGDDAHGEHTNTYDALQRDQRVDGRVYTELITSSVANRNTYLELVNDTADADYCVPLSEM